MTHPNSDRISGLTSNNVLSIIDRTINRYSKTIMGLCQGRKTALQTCVITFDTAHCSDRNTVCFKDLTFLFLTQHKLEWRAVDSVSGTLDRPRVVAPSKTCGHVRSSRRRWRWAQCRPRSAAPTFGRVVLAGASMHSGLMSGLTPVRASTARRSAEWAGVASGSRRTWPKMESRLRMESRFRAQWIAIW